MADKISRKNEPDAGYSGLNKALILGVGVSGTPFSRVIRVLGDKMSESTYDRPYFVVTVNPEFLVLADGDHEFRKILNSADLAIADGWGLRLAKPDLPVVPGRKVVEALVKVNSNGKAKIFYLGGRDGVAGAMARKYGGRYDSGAADIKSQISNPKTQTSHNDQVINKINKYGPDLLLVAYGAPWQEKWIYRYLPELKAKVVMGVGGAFDYLTGKSKLPPEWVWGSGFEWLWRLLHEPWRWKRQLRLVKYLWLLLARKG